MKLERIMEYLALFHCFLWCCKTVIVMFGSFTVYAGIFGSSIIFFGVVKL
ncbi:hypothetical protein Scep_004044 [Stephania cephalantha]|uniref:Uncharacterized protein n=1 Tax=Stephania cephalantha TaxID=152367 RepID=A0AAP0KU81_9MAGN